MYSKFQCSNWHQKCQINKAWLWLAPQYHRNHPAVGRKPSKPVCAGTRTLRFHLWLQQSEWGVMFPVANVTVSDVFQWAVLLMTALSGHLGDSGVKQADTRTEGCIRDACACGRGWRNRSIRADILESCGLTRSDLMFDTDRVWFNSL